MDKKIAYGIIASIFGIFGITAILLPLDGSRDIVGLLFVWFSGFLWSKSL